MARIHPSADDIYFAEHPGERALVRPLLALFDVNHARRKRIGETEVAAIYLKPEPVIAEQLGLERELLLVYSPYPQFQPRAIKVMDELFAQDRTRLDPLATVLVCDDPRTHEAVAEVIATDQDRAPIVAFSRAALEALVDPGALRDQFVRQLFRRDLFGLESPLTRDISFFGRREVVQELVDRFRSGQNSGLFGLRRIGKTSVLYAVQRRVKSDAIGEVRYLDLSNPSLYKARWWELLQIFAKAFAEPLRLQGGKRSRIRALTISYSEADAARHFKADLSTLAEHFAQGRMLLALDEIENITFGISPADHWNLDFLPLFQTLRSVHQDLAGKFCFLLSGVNPHAMEEERVSRFDNPLFGTARALYLGPFDLISVREMVRRLAKFMGLRCQEGLYQALYEEYGGHPFLIRQACSQLSKAVPDRPGTMTCALFEQQRKGIALSLEKIVRQILNVLAIWYPSEYELIAALARGERDEFLEFAQLSAEFTQHMEGYGLVRGAREDPKIAIGLVRSSLSKTPKTAVGLEPKADSPEEILAEISRRRNWIEPRLRRVLRDGLQYAAGKRAASVLLACLSEQRRETLAGYGYDAIWTELYLNELIAVVKGQWAAFQNWFSEPLEEVQRWLEQINRSRSDAHAKQLSEEELAYLRVCFGRLEKKLGGIS